MQNNYTNAYGGINLTDEEKVQEKEEKLENIKELGTSDISKAR